MALTEQEQLELQQIEGELARRSSKPDVLEQRAAGVGERIERRGDTSFGEATQAMQETKAGSGQRAMAMAKIAGMPQERVEAGVANMLMAIQDGKFDNLSGEFESGIRGKKLGEIGDVFRRSKVPYLSSEPVAVMSGILVALVAPMTLMKRFKEAATFGKVAKFTDKGILKAGSKLSQGSDDAVRIIGQNVDNAYAPVNKLIVNSDELVKVVDDIPAPLIKAIERELGGSIDDIVRNANVATTRSIKQIVGKVKPSSFGKTEKGLVETLEGNRINKAYAGLKNVIQDSMRGRGLTGRAEDLLKADDAFTNVSKAARFIKKAVTDPTLREATKAGKVARGLLTSGDVSTRKSLNILLETAPSVNKSIKQAIKHLSKYNNFMGAVKGGTSVAKTALFAGLIGSVGAKTARGILGETQQ